MSLDFEFLSIAARNISKSFFGRILTEKFNKRSDYPISLSHFHPFSKIEKQGRDYVDLSTGDFTTGDRYLGDTPNVIRAKCLALAVATPIVQAIGLFFCLVNRGVKIGTLAHFWHPSLKNCSRTWAFGKDLLHVALLPIFYIGLELSALYGLILPNNGRKLYATFERCAYGTDLLAPCFQPAPKHHLFGGSLNDPNAW